MRRSRMVYWSVVLEGEGSNCFRITQLVGQKKAIIILAKKKCIYLGINHNYIKILESDWSSAGLISAVIVQLYASCLNNWTVRVIKLALVALEWLFFSASSFNLEYINMSNSINHCHILLEFCYSYD